MFVTLSSGNFASQCEDKFWCSGANVILIEGQDYSDAVFRI